LITKVRIAPVEQWCEEAKDVLERNPLLSEIVGLEVEVETGSFEQKQVGRCSGPWWYLTPEDASRMLDLIGRPELKGNPSALCRHCLEMD
jgi:hypothetical protein